MITKLRYHRKGTTPNIRSGETHPLPKGYFWERSEMRRIVNQREVAFRPVSSKARHLLASISASFPRLRLFRSILSTPATPTAPHQYTHLPSELLSAGTQPCHRDSSTYRGVISKSAGTTMYPDMRSSLLVAGCLLLPSVASRLLGEDETMKRPNKFKKWRQETPPKVRVMYARGSGREINRKACVV